VDDGGEAVLDISLARYLAKQEKAYVLGACIILGLIPCASHSPQLETLRSRQYSSPAYSSVMNYDEEQSADLERPDYPSLRPHSP
jgi:hypothetical protein